MDTNDLEALRDKHHLRPLAPEEIGSGIHRLPAGVYGFTYSPASEGSPLFLDRKGQNYEMHKLHDGRAVLIGYVLEDSARHLAVAREPLTLYLFPEPEGDARALVAIATERIVRHREHSQREGKGLEIVVEPI